MSDSREAMRAAVEALEDMIQWVAAFAKGDGSHKVVMDSPRMKDARAALSLLRAALEAREPAEGEQWTIGRAADLLEHYAGYIRDVRPDDLERHPYLPEIDYVAGQLRAWVASPAAATQGDARDAARYRWMRSIDGEGAAAFEIDAQGVPIQHGILVGGHLDDFIDAAIGAESEQATEDGRHG